MKVRAFTELSNLSGSRDTEVMVDSEILKAIKINTKLSSASWKDDWKSCYFDLSQFHLLSLQVALPIILFIPELTCYYLLLLGCVASATNSTVKKKKIFFSQTQRYLWVFTVMFFPFPCPINHQGLAVFLEWYSEWSPDQQSSWELIKNASSWPLQTYLNHKTLELGPGNLCFKKHPGSSDTCSSLTITALDHTLNN